MSPSAVLGPVDPQIGEFPVASILAVVEQKDRDRVDDRTLILADTGRKAQQQTEILVEGLLTKRLSPARARDVAHLLSEGRWTHDFPIRAEQAEALGLPVSTDLPDEVRDLMKLYPQPRGRRPSVEYIPDPYDAPRRDRRGRDRVREPASK
jgi:ClpP class serine protease